MSEKKITTFEQALLDVTLEEFSDIPDKEDEIDVSFSPAFVAKSEKLIRNTEQKTWRYVNTGMKRVAVIAIVAALLATTALAFPAIREAIIRFFIHDEGTHYEFSFDPEQAANAPDCIETVYYPTYVPNGYQLSFDTTTVASVAVGWSNSDDWTIFYMQEPMPDDPENSAIGDINAEGTTTSSLILSGYEVIRVEDAEAIYYVWTNHEYLFSLICDKVLPEEEMVRIFDSVQIDPNAAILGAE